MKNQKAMKKAAKVPKVAKATKVPEKFVKAAKFVMQLQNTNLTRKNLKDANYKEAMKLAEVDDTKKNRGRLGTVVWRMRKDMKKKEEEDPTVPYVLNKELEFKIRLRTLPNDIKEMLGFIAAKMMKDITSGTKYSNITGVQQDDKQRGVKNTGLKQRVIRSTFWKLFGNNRAHDVKEKGTLLQKKLQEFIVSDDALEKMDVEVNAIDISLLFTAKNTHVQQTPHTDYKLVAATKEDIQKQQKLAWTLHLPLTVSGSWITLWNGHGYGTNVHIEFGKCLFLRSDVVHAGGKPDIGSKTDDNFLRLHAYLPTNFQAVDRTNIFLIDYSGQPLEEVYKIHDM